MSATVDRSPARTSAGLAVLAVLLAVGTLGAVADFTLFAGVPGALVLGTGVVRRSRSWVSYGTVLVLVAVTVAGIAGVPATVLVPATLCALVAWDAGSYGIALGEHLGRSADTARAELAHSALTVAVGATGALIGFGAYASATGGQPVLAVLLLFAGAVALVAAIR